MIRDGNGTRSFETLPRYRGAAIAEFWRALKTLKALQAEQAEQAADAEAALPAPPLGTHPITTAARPRLARHPQPDEPEPGGEPRPEYVPSEPPAPARACTRRPRPGCRTNPRLATRGMRRRRPRAERTQGCSRRSARPLRPMARSRPRRPCCRASRTGRAETVTLAELLRPLAALEALRARARDVAGAAPALLEPTGVRTKRIQENEAKTMT
jgi:hypothetical protein